MTSVSLVSNTRHGTLANPKNFSACKWILADPIFAPPNYDLFVELTFLTITNDQERINSYRRTTNVHFQIKDTNDNIRDVWIKLPPSSYSETDYLETLNRAANQINDVVIPPPDPRDFVGVNLEISEADEQQPHLMGREVTFANSRDPGGDDKSSIRIVNSPDWQGAQVLGFHETTDWVPPGKSIISESPMDTWGSCTITICCKALAGNSPDPVSTTRRRTILKVIPASTQEHSKPYIYERFGPRYGHKITPQYISSIDLCLLDDLNCPIDPRHHWCVGLEVYAIKQRKNFMYIM